MNIKTTIAGATFIITAALATGIVTQNLAGADSSTYSEQYNVADLEVPAAWKFDEPGWRL